VWRHLADWLYRQGSLARAKQQGFEFGVVVDVEDPWKMGRIRVRFPWHYPGDMSDWALPASGAMGNEIGSTFNIPQVDDLVLCIFYGGDITRPAYTGSIWTGGGVGPRGAIKPRTTIIKGYEPQAPNPDSYDPMVQPDPAPKPYPEPAEGPWLSNDPKTRVNGFKTFGGLRLLLEEMKRRLRIWTHPDTPFKLKVEHFDGDSVDPPRSTPYHRAVVESPAGTQFEIEEDGSAANYVTRITFHTGLELRFEYLGAGATAHKVTLHDPGGEMVVLNEKDKRILIQDRDGAKMLFDAQAHKRTITDPAGNSVELDQPNQAIKLTSPGNIDISATGTLTLNGTAGVAVTSDGNINIG